MTQSYNSQVPILLVVRSLRGFTYEIRRWGFASPLLTGPEYQTEGSAREAGRLALAEYKLRFRKDQPPGEFE
jgi:hypothetical protein